MILLLSGVSLVGLIYPGIYQGATDNWLAQTVGQDAIDLFLVVPVLIVGTLYSSKNNKAAAYLWAGTMLYIAYTFCIYCFAVRFNPLFIPYCLILGLSVFSLIWHFAVKSGSAFMIDRKLIRTTGIYFIAISVLFYVIWLSEIVPAALSGVTPASLISTGLITNPVHVLDLSLLLPATLFVGVMALADNPTAHHMTPVLLTFFFLMDVTIAVLAFVLANRDLSESGAVPIVMIALALFSLFLLIRILNTKS